jgi:hypothetical protein
MHPGQRPIQSDLPLIVVIQGELAFDSGARGKAHSADFIAMLVAP